MTATRKRGLLLGAGTLLIALGVWMVAAWLLWETSVPGDLRIADLAASDYFTQDGARRRRPATSCSIG